MSTARNLLYTEPNKKIIEASVNNLLSGATTKQRLSNYTRETIYQINTQLTQGLIRGESYATMARRIKDVVNNDFNNAIRIAATETHRTSIEGHLSSMDYAREAGVRLKKVWSCTLDGRTREGHRDVDGQKRDIDEDFEYQIEVKKGVWVTIRTPGPGQSGVAADVINCRCSVRSEIEGMAPELRRAGDKIIPYQTYTQWMGNHNFAV
jgi:uncharacterized protein with gpF-like domain